MADAPLLVPIVGGGVGCGAEGPTVGASMAQTCDELQVEIVEVDQANADPRSAADNMNQANGVAAPTNVAANAIVAAQTLPPVAEVIGLIAMHFTVLGFATTGLAQIRAKLGCNLLWVPCMILVVMHVLLLILAWYGFEGHLTSTTRKAMSCIVVGAYLFITATAGVAIFYAMLCA